MITQNKVPNEAHRESMGVNTPKNASHGLLRTRSRRTEVPMVNRIIITKDTNNKGIASIPKRALLRDKDSGLDKLVPGPVPN